MRRIAILGVLVATAVVVVRARGAQVHERLMAHCEGMFERMPDTLPPKKMLRGIEEIRTNTARILELLEVDEEPAATTDVPEVAAHEVAHDAA